MNLASNHNLIILYCGGYCEATMFSIPWAMATLYNNIITSAMME